MYRKPGPLLITGAGGSIGSELCRQIAALNPKKLVILDHSENQIFEIHNELLKTFPSVAFAQVIADLRHARRISHVFEKYNPTPFSMRRRTSMSR